MSTSDIDDAGLPGRQVDPAVGHMVFRLARRQQSLVSRVLVVLEELQQDETSASRLDRLFRVDHLVTLLGRSASSLGVLLDTTTRATDRPLGLDEALQAAIAGVDDFRRVVVSPAPEVDVINEAAPDVVHLLTEIIDYSLAFSGGADTDVSMHSPGADGHVVIRVANPHLNFREAQLAAINTMLRPGGPSLPGCPQSTNLYVASRLAHRHGIDVHLGPTEGGGAAATIRLPSPILVLRMKPPSPAYAGRHRKELPSGPPF